MKGSKNFLKTSPEEFAKARDSIKIIFKKKTISPIKFRNEINN